MTNKTLVAAVFFGFAGEAKADYQHDAADREILQNFQGGILATPRRDLYNQLPMRVTMAAQHVERNACWGPYRAMQGAQENAHAQRDAIGDGAQRAAVRAREDYDACMNSFRGQVSQMVAGAMLASVSAGAYIGQMPGGAQARERVDLLCNNAQLIPDSGACRRWFQHQFELLDRQQNPSGYIGAPRTMPIGVALFGSQNAGNGTGLAWQMLGAFSNGNTVSGPVGGGPVATGSR
ncbi:MAG: hypothetical protein HY928_05370 [Elusimicrobia bacterium]|nr:hypothetical protein [Elusimicrobiota bacterium]